MQVSVSDAKGQLTDLVRRAEAGEDVLLTRHGQPVARLTPIKPVLDRQARKALMEAISLSGAAKVQSNPEAAGGHDFLYDEDGLPK
ncbi:MAG: type II toxin-antitoxin system prevent-host-death family antitoxin [Caulobacteraceae bacterium]